MSNMTPKRLCFVQEYLIDLNATQAAIRAGYSVKTANVQASQMLADPDIATAIEKAMAKRSERTEITQDRVLNELAKIGFRDIRKIFSPGGNLLSPVDLDDDTAAAVDSIEVIERPKKNEAGEIEIEHIKKIKMADKRAALVDIGKHLGMFKERIEHSGPDGAPIAVEVIELVGPGG